jgi:pSer/pThr/pTyr-binding forkhead associated (FHA) protein
VPEAVVFILRAVVLVLLWGFVVAAIVAVRHDFVGPTAPLGPADINPPAEAKRARRDRQPLVARQLMVTEGTQTGTTANLRGLPLTIGRAEDCDLPLTDDYASNHHARLVPAGDGWQLEDTGSTNGSFVDGTRVTTPVPVGVGVPIRIGRTVLELRP